MCTVGALRHNVALTAIVAATSLSCVLAAHWGLPDGASAATASSWAVDTIAPLGPLSEANARFMRVDSEAVIYPLFHYVVLCAAFVPYIGYTLLTGSLSNPHATFPYGAADPGAFFTSLTLIASLVSAAMAAGIVLCVYLIARDLFDRRSGLWAAAFAAVVPPLTYYGSTSNLEVPYLFWTMLAMWQLVRAAKYQRFVNYCLCGVLAGLAFATKDQAAGFFMSWPLLVVLLVALHRRTTEPTSNLLRAVLDRRVLGAGIAALLAFAFGNNLLFGGWEGFLRHLAFASEFYEANVAHQATGMLGRQPLLFGHSAGLVVQMVGVPVLVLAAGGLVLAWRQRIHLSLLLPLSALTYYISTIAPTTTLSRYLLGIVLLLMPFAGYATSNALAATKRGTRIAGTALLTLALLWQFALVVHLHSTLWRDSRYALERWVRDNVPTGTIIESSTQARYLPRLSDRYRYSVVGNSFDAVSYALLANELTLERLEARSPPYILVLSDVGLSGDPGRVTEPALREYYGALLGGRSGYSEVSRFETPTWLPYRQLTVGTQPTSILLKRNPSATNGP